MKSRTTVKTHIEGPKAGVLFSSKGFKVAVYIQILYILIKILPQKVDFWAKKWHVIQSGALIKSGLLIFYMRRNGIIKHWKFTRKVDLQAFFTSGVKENHDK